MSERVDLDALEKAAEEAMYCRRQDLCACSPEQADHWFDRSICPEPCGSMHYHCSTCLRGVDRCVLREQPARVVRVDAVVLRDLVSMARTTPTHTPPRTEPGDERSQS